VKVIESETEDEESAPILKGCRSGESIEDIIGQIAPNETKPIFPFRYFGDFSSMQDLLKSALEDKGMPKSSSRVGKDYQAELPEFTDSVMEENRLLEEKRVLEAMETVGGVVELPVEVKGRGRAWRKGTGNRICLFFNDLDIPGGCLPLQRGNELVFKPPPGPIDDEQINEYFSKSVAVFPQNVNVTRSVDIKDRALAELQAANYEYDAAFAVMQGLKWADLGINTWTAAEVSAFESGISFYGYDLFFIRKTVYLINLTQDKNKQVDEGYRLFLLWMETYAKICSVLLSILKDLSSD
jgi:hypothetical protein